MSDDTELYFTKKKKKNQNFLLVKATFNSSYVELAFSRISSYYHRKVEAGNILQAKHKSQ